MADYLPPTKIASMISTEERGTALLEAAVHGDKRKVKKILKSGINCDHCNNEGQTPLWCACYEGHSGIVDLLLQHGANPNERCSDGSTPVHAAGQSCHPKILSNLIEAGADLRLHDKRGRTIKDCIMCQTDTKKRHKMVEYLEKARTMAMTESSRDLLLERQPSSYHTALRGRETATASFVNLFKAKSNQKILTLSPSVHSNGFGKIYCGDGEHVGTMATIPLVNETSIRHDEYGYTFNNGPFMVMESMLWNKVPVTVKRLHREPKDGGNVDLLIKENEYMARLRHPNLLLMMAVCQTNNLDGLLLLYERIGCGSLYSYLYQKVDSLDTLTMCEVMKQIADAVLYLHQENLLHCSITSHAVQLVLPNFAKLGNFEYMIDSATPDAGALKSKVVDNKYLNAVFNWLAPEMLAGKSPTKKSDLYGLCAVLWEILHGMPPWCGMHAPEIQTEVVENRNMLDIKESIKNPFSALLQYGLAVEPKGRQISVEQFRNILGQVLVDHDTMGIKGDTPHPQRSSRTYQPVKKAHHQESVSSADEETLDLKIRQKKKTPSNSMKLSPRVRKSPETPDQPRPLSDSSDPETLLPIIPVNIAPVSAIPQNLQMVNKGTSPGLSAKSPHQLSRDHTDSVKQPEALDKNNNSASGQPEPSHEENDDEFFIRDRAKSEFFGVSTWTQPNSTSTPTSASPAFIPDIQGTDASVINTTVDKKDDQKDADSTQVSNCPLSPQNPFKREYQKYQSQDIKTSISSVLATKPSVLTSQHSRYVVPTTNSFSSLLIPTSKSTTSNHMVLKKSTSTVYGALLGEHVTKVARPNAVLKDNYFIAQDSQSQLDEETITSQKAGPVYLTARQSSISHTLPVGSRHSYAENKPTTHPGRVTSQMSWNTIGTRHSWAVANNQHEDPGCFKPASHRSGFTTSPGRTSHPLSGGSSSRVNFAVPETQPSELQLGGPQQLCGGPQQYGPQQMGGGPQQYGPQSYGPQKYAAQPGGPHGAQPQPYVAQSGGPQAGGPQASGPPHPSGPHQYGPRGGGSPTSTNMRSCSVSAMPKSTRFSDGVDGAAQFRGDGPAVTPMRPYYSHHDVYDCNAAVPMLQEQPSPERLSPREVKQEWYGETGGIKNIISCFQDHTDEHFKKQAILVKNSKARAKAGDLWPQQKEIEQEMQQQIQHQKEQQQRQQSSQQQQQQQQPVHTERVETTTPGVDERQSCLRPSQIVKKNINVEKTIEVTPDGMRHVGPSLSMDIYPATNRFKSEYDGVQLSTCPSHVHTLQYASGKLESESETDQEVYEAIDTALEQAHSQVLERYSHPECPHRVDSISRVKGMSKHNLNNNCAASGSYPCTPVNGPESSHMPAASWCSNKRAFTTQISSLSQRTNDDGDLTMVSDFETERKENDIEDIYFDDVLSSDLMKEKHMRLQSTLPLDSTTMSQSTFSDLMRSPMLGPASTSRNTSKNTSYDPLLSISGLDEANISQRKARKDMKIRTSKSYDSPRINVSGGNELRATPNKSVRSTHSDPGTHTKTIKIVMEDEEFLV